MDHTPMVTDGAHWYGCRISHRVLKTMPLTTECGKQEKFGVPSSTTAVRGESW